MRLEDAFLYMILDASGGAAPEEVCAAAIAGGVDIIHASSSEMDRSRLAAVREICRRDDALLVVSDDAAAASAVDADGVHLGSVEDSIGQARAIMGGAGVLGVSTQSGNDAPCASIS